MDRSTWTDERLDDRFDQIERRFDQVDGRLDRIEIELRSGFAEVRHEIAELRSTVFRRYGGTLIAMFGLIAAILARGAG